MILQAMPEQSNHRSELPREIYRATSSLRVQDSQMPHNGSNHKNTIKRTNKHQNNHKNILVNRPHRMTILKLQNLRLRKQIINTK
jgi:hypothetical protein